MASIIIRIGLEKGMFKGRPVIAGVKTENMAFIYVFSTMGFEQIHNS